MGAWRYGQHMGRLVLLFGLCGALWGQNVATAGRPEVGQAPAGMQQSLAQQQAAIDAFRENVKAGSVAQQEESIKAQLKPLQPKTAPVGAGPSGKNAFPKSSSGESPSQSLATASSDFFSVPWPGSLPLAMPNVQRADVSCDALDPKEVNKLVESAAVNHGLDRGLVKSVMKQESAFKPCALSVAGAMGLMQIMPDTADMLHLDDPFDPAKNVDAGAKFLKSMLDRFGGDVAMALAAYNAGPTTVDKAGGIPPIAETLKYVSNILGDLPAAY